MSEREFETYLTLLCRLLRLGPEQREAIARELRDHLEERLADLKARGVPHDAAVQTALEEFGDAAGLAAEFSFIARNVRRRWLMRMTVGSSVAAAALMLAIMALWPDGKKPGPLPTAAIAQAQAQPAAEEAFFPHEGAQPAADGRQAPAEPLSQRVSAEFIEIPLRDVLAFLSAQVGGQLYLNEKRLADAEIAVDALVSIEVKDLRAATFLDLVLEQVSADLAYVVRDGIVLVSTLDDLEGATEVRVYNVRDLLKPHPLPSSQDMMGMGPMDMRSMGSPGMAMPGAGIYEMAGSAGGGGSFAALSLDDRAAMLSRVIEAAIGNGYWADGGGTGTIASYDGLLVVNHNARIHRQVEQLLEMLRTATAQGQPERPAASPPPQDPPANE